MSNHNNSCQFCGNKLNPQQIKENIPSRTIKFFNERVPDEAEVIPYSDAFVEVVKGKYKGNLIHIFDIIK